MGRTPRGKIREAVLATLATRRGELMALNDIYASVHRRVDTASDSAIRSALQKLRPQTENARRGFWRLKRS